jgi:MurE/MurF fusion protein
MSASHAHLQELVSQLRSISPAGALCMDSRQIVAGDVFVACPGLATDGRDFIGDALSRGAVAVLHEKSLSHEQRQMLGDVPAWPVEHLRVVLGDLASAWWGNPSESLTIIAITGTNGKTTTAQWLSAALRADQVRCGTIGTLGVTDVTGQSRAGLLTTPEVLSLHHCLADLLAQGATHVVMEASSIGLDQGRLDAVKIDIGVFTNLTQDHLDYHGDMASYGQAKAMLFKRAQLKHAVLNADDPSCALMRSGCAAPVLTYGMRSSEASLRALDVKPTEAGQCFKLSDGLQSVDIETGFVGAHAVANLLAVAGVLRAIGWSFEKVGNALGQLPAVAGRLEPVRPIARGDTLERLPIVLVDYAHTPDALINVLQAVKPLARAQGGRLWCVMGCGGNRDAHKRPLMAQAASAHADQVVLTSDNPRDEDPNAILQAMLGGLTETVAVQVEPDRAVAILSAIWKARSNDVVLLAGKGHEHYQEVAGQRYPFDDRQWAQLALLMAQSPVPVQTDSRQLTPGALFVALRGERFDGHDYLESVQSQGAVAAIVECADPTLGLPQIVLGDTLKALQTMATAWRRRFTLPVIGITGSNGKTTTKEMTATICRAWVGVDDTLSTSGNLNNEIGVPLTIMRLREHHRVAVIEMGMNHPGEISVLASIAQPTVALVLNAQREHQEFMQSVQAVAQENGQVLLALSNNATAVYPANDVYSDLWANLSSHTKNHVTFGPGEEAVLSIQGCKLDALGSQFTLTLNHESVDIDLPVAGLHNVLNAAAATACATAAGASMVTAKVALASFSAVKGRLQVYRLAGGQTLVDDTYNANPDSVRAAIDVLATLTAPRALVLGDMGEVGENGAQMHAEVGQYAREQSIDFLWALGQATRESVDAFGEQARWFDSPDALCEYADAVSPASVLVKGSRFMAMERVVHQWLQTHMAATEQGGTHAG